MRRLIRSVGDRRHQERIGTSEECAHGSVARSVANRNTSHVERVGNHETLKVKLVAKKAGEDVRRESGGSRRVRFEHGNVEVAGHNAADTGGNRSAEGNEFEGFHALAIGFDDGQIDVRVGGSVAVAGEMFCGGESAVFLDSANEFANEIGHALGIFAEGARIDDGRASSAVILPMV